METLYLLLNLLLPGAFDLKNGSAAAATMESLPWLVEVLLVAVGVALAAGTAVIALIALSLAYMTLIGWREIRRSIQQVTEKQAKEFLAGPVAEKIIREKVVENMYNSNLDSEGEADHEKK